MFDLINLEEVRPAMLSEIQADVNLSNLYISDRLNDDGRNAYPLILLEAARSSNITGFEDALHMGYFNSHSQRKKPKGGYSLVKMPFNANAMLCEGEFNRFYIRGVYLN